LDEDIDDGNSNDDNVDIDTVLTDFTTKGNDNKDRSDVRTTIDKCRWLQRRKVEDCFLAFGFPIVTQRLCMQSACHAAEDVKCRPDTATQDINAPHPCG